MAGDLAMLQVVVSFAVLSTLGRFPDKISCMKVVGELVAEFQRLEG
jgi:hypothetical protein